MMKITGLSHLFKWENLHNWWLTKYFFAPLYIYIYKRNSYRQTSVALHENEDVCCKSVKIVNCVSLTLNT